MTETGTNGEHRFVTTGQLADKIEAVRQEQRAEHWKTRLVVAILSLPSALKAAPAILGFVGVSHGWIPW